MNFWLRNWGIALLSESFAWKLITLTESVVPRILSMIMLETFASIYELPGSMQNFQLWFSEARELILIVSFAGLKNQNQPEAVLITSLPRIDPVVVS